MHFHHLGIFVKDLEYGNDYLNKLLPIKKSSKIYHDTFLKVSVQFLYDDNNMCYEIVAPNGKNNPVDLVLKNKKNILNHIAYKTNNLEHYISYYREKGCFQCGDPKPALAFDNARIVFFYTPLKILIELIEKK